MRDALRSALDRLSEVADLIEADAAEAEDSGRLTDAVVDALEERRLLHALVPEELGGLGLTLPESIELSRAVSTHDASTGWTLAILTGGGLYGRLLDRECFAEMVAAGAPTTAGSLNPLSARAEPIDGGYRFTGKAPYASGCHHARWLLMNAWVVRDGQRSWIDALPEFVAALAPMSSGTILDTWHPSGMRATGSHDCTFEDLEVPAEWTFSWTAPVDRYSDDAFSGIPLNVQIGPILASSAVGAARHARDTFVELSGGKRPVGSGDVLADRAYAQIAAGEAESMLVAAEDTLAAAARDVWAQGDAHRPFTNEDRARMRARVVASAQLAARSVDLLHGVSGMSSTVHGSVFERVWRDVHTATQHLNLNVLRHEIVGKVILGRDPGPLPI